MTKCPDCGGKLGDGAIKCRCGWGKPMLPAAHSDPRHVQCADDQSCRKPGRMWVEGMPPKDRVCVDHYYARLERRS